MLPILNQLRVDIEILENPYNLPIDQLFEMAARINKKRSFLFVSKILGKHIPIDPKTGILIGALLANRYLEIVKGEHSSLRNEMVSAFMNEIEDSYCEEPFINKQINPVIIGFAETATALGHAFYQSFHNADYFHTTREQIVGLEPVITFEEEHSHATSHRCYVDEALLNNNREVILVDDEMTTGKTTINIIRSIQKRFPRDMYTVVSILDWRSEENLEEFKDLERELGITIQSVNLLKGRMNASGSPNIKYQAAPTVVPQASQTISTIFIDEVFPEQLTLMNFSSKSWEGKVRHVPYLKETGRFGINSISNSKLNQSTKKMGAYLADLRNGRNTLCLGTGEFMYIPMKISSYMGSGVCYQSTTRSPIYVDNHDHYGARYGLSFPNPDDWEIDQYVYNIPPYRYDDLFIFFERVVTEQDLSPLLNELKRSFIKDIKIVFFNGGLVDE
ncbi:phosphoribosyltransferase family protein [Bacillus sp. FJAT-49705]|uniref:Phosphoribosyltransferase family protein n=2 Tax=Cytobacillus citreus TaxID=2833586 RepID=A0ABS5NU44_9BACI|nr:phosphoribosyltransferase family protein [Cytobacillus citreus]